MALTLLDAGVIIGILDDADAHHAAARAAVQSALARGDILAVPASAYAECLVAPARRGRQATQAVDAFLADLAADVEPITRQLAAKAAHLRARHGTRLRLPDALVLATALHLRADRVLTTDAGWPAVGVPVEVVTAPGG
ncbi:MAG TPA: PIN domain-containing protein [Candidatus Limnocylindria bacterium]|nr:PIN domain-containing protein [Candidatus Limnocylindria bacterium]